MVPSALIPLLLAGGKAALGGIQALRGGQLAKGAKRPTYEIPSAVSEQVRIAKAQALNNRLPGQSAAEQAIQGSTQAGIRAAQETGPSNSSIMATIAALNANQNTASQNLATQGAQFQQGNIQNLQSTLGSLANYQDKKFEYNQQKPFEDKAAAAAALKGAGIQNISSGLTDAAGIAMLSGMGQNNKKSETTTNSGGFGVDTISEGVPKPLTSSDTIGVTNLSASQKKNQTRAQLMSDPEFMKLNAAGQYAKLKELGLI